MKVVFLDIDGVLNTHEELHPEVLCGTLHRDKVDRLNGVLRITSARLVLSSAWRYLIHRGEMNLTGMEWLLRSHGVLAGRLIGITRADTMMPPKWDGSTPWPVEHDRGKQIAEFLETFTGVLGVPCSGYVVLDDLDLGIRAAKHPLVHVDPGLGLTDDDAKQAECWLS